MQRNWLRTNDVDISALEAEINQMLSDLGEPDMSSAETDEMRIDLELDIWD